ncbi:MAG: tetratricopeptide repeat protein [Syntrophomonas sp.]
MNKKKILIITGLIAIVILAVGAGLWSRGAADRAQEKLDLAVKYISENDFEKAVLAYNDAINIDAKQVKAYQGLARVYTVQGKYDEAKAAYEKGVSAVAAGDQNTLRLGLAGMYIDKGQLPDAEKAYQELINGSQNCLEAYWGLAMVYQKQGDNAKAEATLRQAIAKYPNDYRGYNTLALFLKQNNKADDAFNNLVKSLSLQINQQEAYLVFNDMYKGRWTELQAKLTAVSNQQISSMLEFYLLYASEDYSKAVNAYKAQLNGQSGNHKARILYAIAMFKTGDKSGAEILINQVSNENFNEWLLSDVAFYYQVAGNNEKARLSAIKAIQAHGTNLEAIALLQKLNTGDEKKYAAEFLLYNWSPVAKVKDELQVKSLPVPGSNVIPTTNTTPANRTETSDFSIKGVEMGMSKAEVIRLLGNPLETKQTYPPNIELVYPDIRVVVYDKPIGHDAGQGVYAIMLLNDKISTARGLRLGDPKSKAFELYGDRLKPFDDYYYYTEKEELSASCILIDFTGEKVSTISISRNAEISR